MKGGQHILHQSIPGQFAFLDKDANGGGSDSGNYPMLFDYLVYCKYRLVTRRKTPSVGMDIILEG